MVRMSFDHSIAKNDDRRDIYQIASLCAQNTLIDSRPVVGVYLKQTLSLCALMCAHSAHRYKKKEKITKMMMMMMKNDQTVQFRDAIYDQSVAARTGRMATKQHFE